MSVCNVLLIHVNNSDYFFIPDLLDHNPFLVVYIYYYLYSRWYQLAYSRVSSGEFKDGLQDLPWTISRIWTKKTHVSKCKKLKTVLLLQQPIESTNPLTLYNSIERERYCFTLQIQLPTKHSTSNTLKFYVHVLNISDESFAPLLILNYVLNPFDMVWHWTSFGLYGSIFLATSRVWLWADIKYHPCRLYLLRGGRVIKV